MGEMKQAHIVVIGKVQGVFFRAFAKQNAGKLGLRGFTRNRSDGTLEIMVQGDEENIKKLAKLCKMGPLMAKVDDLKIEWIPVENEFEHFNIRY